MSLSLQDQLLKAGLGDKKKAAEIKREKHKKVKKKQKHKISEESQSKLAAEQARQQKIERDRQLNAQRKAEQEQKALVAQIRQLIEVNRQPKNNGEIAFNFTDGNLVKRVLVDKQTQNRLSQGKLAIAKLDEQYEIIPVQVCDKITQRDGSAIVYRVSEADKQTAQSKEEDDWYAEYEIPDDLMW